MSGVVGWVDFERDLRLHRPVITTMAGTLAPRGPDAESTWVSQRAAFGYRGLAVGEGRPEPQPVVVEHAGGTVVACVTGFPLGWEELVGRLRGRRVDLRPGAGAAEVLAHAHTCWGDEPITGLGGAFAVVLWDTAEEELLLARSITSGQALYVAETPTGVILGSERKAVLAHPATEPEVDVDGLREAVSHALPTGPLFRGLEQVDGAQIARFGRTGWKRRTYWQLRTAPHPDDADTTVARVRSMIASSVRRHVPDDPSRLTVMLSGGIDSSSVAALAAAELRRRGGTHRLRTFTIDPIDDGFRPDVMRTTRDAPFAEAVAEHIGSDQTTVRLRPTDTLDPLVRIGLLRANDGPTRIYDMDAAQHLFLQHVSAQGDRVAMTGYGADNAFLGANWSNDQGLVTAGTFPWVALAQRYGAVNGFGTGLLSADVLRLLDLPTYYRDSYTTAVARVEHLPGESEQQRLVRRVSHLVITLFRSDHAVFAAAGLQSRSPISSPELLQYAYNVPAELQRHGGQEKGLLRAAVADLLPPEIVHRPRSAAPVGNDPGYPHRLTAAFAAVLADRGSPVRALIDLPAALALAEQTDRVAADRMARADIELALQLNTWLDHYRVRLKL